MATEVFVKQCRGLKTAWLQAGPKNKAIIYFMHGYPDTADSWDQQLSYFAEEFTVVAPYARGVRPSERATDLRRYGLDAVCLDHLEILRSVDPTQKRDVYCVAHDLGGVQAWRLAPLLGKRLRGLVIINSLSIEQMARRMTDVRQLRKSWYIYGLMVPRWGEWIARKNPAKILRAAHALAELSPAHRPALAKTVAGVINPIKQYRALLGDFFGSLTAKPQRIQAPVLVLWSKSDSFLQPIRADELRDFAVDTSIRILRGNHWIHRDQAAVVNTLIREFLCP